MFAIKYRNAISADSVAESEPWNRIAAVRAIEQWRAAWKPLCDALLTRAQTEELKPAAVKPLLPLADRLHAGRLRLYQRFSLSLEEWDAWIGDTADHAAVAKFAGPDAKAVPSAAEVQRNFALSWIATTEAGSAGMSLLENALAAEALAVGTAAAAREADGDATAPSAGLSESAKAAQRVAIAACAAWPRLAGLPYRAVAEHLIAAHDDAMLDETASDANSAKSIEALEAATRAACREMLAVPHLDLSVSAELYNTWEPAEIPKFDAVIARTEALLGLERLTKLEAVENAENGSVTTDAALIDRAFSAWQDYISFEMASGNSVGIVESGAAAARLKGGAMARALGVAFRALAWSLSRGYTYHATTLLKRILSMILEIKLTQSDAVAASAFVVFAGDPVHGVMVCCRHAATLSFQSTDESVLDAALKVIVSAAHAVCLIKGEVDALLVGAIADDYFNDATLRLPPPPERNDNDGDGDDGVGEGSVSVVAVSSTLVSRAMNALSLAKHLVLCPQLHKTRARLFAASVAVLEASAVDASSSLRCSAAYDAWCRASNNGDHGAAARALAEGRRFWKALTSVKTEAFDNLMKQVDPVDSLQVVCDAWCSAEQLALASGNNAEASAVAVYEAHKACARALHLAAQLQAKAAQTSSKSDIKHEDERPDVKRARDEPFAPAATVPPRAEGEDAPRRDEVGRDSEGASRTIFLSRIKPEVTEERLTAACSALLTQRGADPAVETVRLVRAKCIAFVQLSSAEAVAVAVDEASLPTWKSHLGPKTLVAIASEERRTQRAAAAVETAAAAAAAFSETGTAADLNKFVLSMC